MSAINLPKIILITGTSSGFGLLSAARLSSKGHIVYATMRDVSRSKFLIEEVSARQSKVNLRELDVTKPETIAHVVKEIVQNHHRIDVLINNAGYGIGGFFEDLTPEEIRSQMEVNFFGVQNVCREVLPVMRAQKSGKIINISSIAGQTASPCLGAYNASKWALEGFSESLYHELSLFGIHVVLVEPGSYPTKIFFENALYAKNFSNPESPYFDISQRFKTLVSDYVSHLKRNPEDVAKLIEKIVDNPRPNLRYISDWQSWLHVTARKILPPCVYTFFYRNALYGNKKHSV